jgi:CRP-like cAMP-binding protein
MTQSDNRLLNALPQNVFSGIKSSLKPIELVFGDEVAATGQPVKRVYFPTSGVVSLVVEMKAGGMVETAMVGRDGAANAMAAMDGNLSLHRAMVQVAGQALAIAPDALRNLVNDYPPLRSSLLRHEQLVLAQAQQSAGCNASHTVEERMCRWLLRIRDLTGSDEMKLTQEFLAQMLGVRRTSVSIIASTLQRANLIDYRRGNIKIIDVGGLEECACECYQTVKSHYEQMLQAN